jgi:kinesin family member C2/C3
MSLDSSNSQSALFPCTDPAKSSSTVQINQQATAVAARQMPKSNSTDHVPSVNSATSRRFPLPVVNAERPVRTAPLAQNVVASPPLGRQSQHEETETTGTSSELPNPLPSPTNPTTTPGDAITTSKHESGTEKDLQATKPSNEVPPGNDDVSLVSSITGAAYDQDLVEELHMALTKMKQELDESRAEAARAVKVAEQAIQSAEKGSSKDWNATVTHKAAEAAAIAQKRSAEALATARLAEERLEQEKKKAAAFRKQAEAAAEEAGHWQVRAAVAEVQRAAMAELLDSQRLKSTGLSTGAPKSELERIRSKLAEETATRRKLLNEVQDLRGQIRVYCRLRAPTGTSVVSLASQEVLILHRECASLKGDGTGASTPLGYEFDGILGVEATQQEVYGEVEDVCLSAIDGYKSCIMTYGQSGAGKTFTMVGDVTYDRSGEVTIGNFGIHLQAARQFFSILGQRTDRYEDVLTFSVVEVSNERLVDLLAGSEGPESSVVVETSSKSTSRKESPSLDGVSESDKPVKLEIKTNRDGETAVQGLVSVKVTSFEDLLRIWRQSLTTRRRRVLDQGIAFDDYRTNSHIIATFRVNSKNITTGVSTVGKIQFVDFASSNVVPLRTGIKKALSLESDIEGVGIGVELKYTNRSIATLSEVMTARSRFQRTVPYRNSTITHLLSDSLEADTKVVLVACVSSDLKDLADTACALKFAQTARKVVIGKATKHTNTPVL